MLTCATCRSYYKTLEKTNAHTKHVIFTQVSDKQLCTVYIKNYSTHYYIYCCEYCPENMMNKEIFRYVPLCSLSGEKIYGITNIATTITVIGLSDNVFNSLPMFLDMYERLARDFNL